MSVIALSPNEEKDSKVKNWNEFTTKYDKAYVISDSSAFPIEANVFCTQSQLTLHEAKALASFSKLLKLRRDWIGEWEPDWTSSNYKYVLYRVGYTIRICGSINTASSLAFPSNEMAKEFLETFRDLIEEAKILI